MKKQQGYTLTELLIAAGVVVLVVTIAVPLYRDYQQSAEDAAVLAHITELEEPLVTYTLTHEPVDVCQDYAKSVNLPLLDNNQVDLNLTFSLIDDTDVSLGYRASVVVSADATQSIDVARDVHENMSERSRVAPNAVLTDSLVAYEVYLTPANDAFCMAMSTTPTSAQGSNSGSVAGTPAGNPASLGVRAPSISFNFSTQQSVIEFGDTGTGSVMNNGPLKTNGDMKELAVEFNVIGGKQVATSGLHGATFLSYGVSGNENEFYAWKPADLTVRINKTEYATGIDTTADGGTHRYSILWSSITGRLQVFVDGESKFTKDGVADGYSIPGGGVLALAQDQDRFQLEDGTHGDNHGFAPQDAFHGQYFSASLANKLPDQADLEKAPLAHVVPAANLVTNMQMSAGGATDLTGNHQLTVRGDINSRVVSVDTNVATPNPGASLTISVTATSQDSLIGLKLVGLLSGTTVTDGAGNSGSGSSMSILGWDLSSIKAKLPDGVLENMNIGVIGTAKGMRGDLATGAQYQPLVLDPTKAVPPKST